MKKLYILFGAAIAMLATGCSKENGFDVDAVGEGQVLKSAIAMDVNADALMSTRAGEDVNPDDFTVLFTKTGQTEPTRKYKYGEMPEVVSLPAGEYKVTATLGENRQSEWESPYFLGQSESFEVIAYEITSYIEPIVCRLDNIKVTVDFDSALRNVMSADSYVEVKVGNASALKYGLAEADSQKGGYFMHSDEISLVATFYGTVEGQETVETKSLKDIRKGCHYKITFKLHTGTGNDPTGDIEGNITTDASVSVVNVETNVEIGDEPLIEGGDRPVEGEDPVDPTPDDPVNPIEPVAPEITAEAPINLDIVNIITQADIENGIQCVLNIHSTAAGGIQEFTCHIDSEKLDADALIEIGLMPDLNIADTPEDIAGILAGLGLPQNVKGQQDAKFDISTFLGLLAGLGEGQSNFVLTVTDANGTTTKTLKLKL